MKLLSSRRRRIAAAAVLLLLLFLLRPGASRLKSRIIASMSSAVGRSVDIGSVHVRLLPRPGFDLENLVVYDDPAFGAEPMLRASEVTAVLRLTSLLRGRIEIARLELTEPSLNLVHRENGGWNLEALLERTAHSPLAPTAKAKSEPRPGFPYIQASSARINFMNGPEKKPYVLSNADFSLWQESDNEWGLRLKAQPVRTDLNLNDTGVLQLNGKWQRATIIRDTPVDLSVEWSGAQLGQLTKLFTGSDLGWRGEVQLDVALSGTPARLQVASSASLQDFRRYDITSGQALRLAARCEGEYHSPEHRFHEVICTAPVGTGMVTLKGDMALPGQHSYALELSLENVPASAAAAMAQRAKKNLPADLTASGTISASMSIQRDGAASSQQLEGQGEAVDFRLASVANQAEMGPRTIPFLLAGDASSGSAAIRRASRKNAVAAQIASGPHLEFGPFLLWPAHSGSLTVRGWTSGSGYDLNITGDADIAKVLQVARLAGLPALRTTAEGAALMDLQIGGRWAGWGSASFPGPEITGTAKLRNIHVPVRGASGTAEIVSADLQFSPDVVRVEKLSAKAAGATWTGSIEMPRGCGMPSACEVHFDLTANQVNAGDVIAWARAPVKERAWYQVLESNAPAPPSFLAALHASGHLAAEGLQIKKLALAHASANVRLNAGRLELTEMKGEAFGAKHRGEWVADYREKPAVCSGSGDLTGLSLARLEDAVKDVRAAGTGSASYQVKGVCGPGFWQSAEGSLRFEISDAVAPRISLVENEGPLRIAHMSGQARLHAGMLEMKDVSLDSAEGKFQLSGTLSLQRQLELKLTRTPNGSGANYAITGTLSTPHVAPQAGAEQARLKPEPTK